MADLVSDPTQVEKVKEEHEKGLVSCLQKIRQWEKFKVDYEALQERLKTLPDKIAYNIMVPFGSHAFMPGSLVHTNSITVLLGDNWFANVSAKQASGIAERRVKQCEKMLQDLQKERQQFENWLGFIVDVSDENLVDIKEQYDPEKEKVWREQHRKNVQEHRKKISQERTWSADVQSNEGCSEQNAAIESIEHFERLNELENEEEEEQDISSSEEAEEEDGSVGMEKTEEENNTSKNIEANVVNIHTVQEHCEIEKNHDKDENYVATVTNSDEKNDNGDQKRHVRWIDLSEANSKKITFTHSTIKSTPPKKKHRRKRKNSLTSEEEDDDKTMLVINSPSDIYKCFSYSVQQSKPKSILKVINSNSISENSLPSLDSPSNEKSHSISNGILPKVIEANGIEHKVKDVVSNDQNMNMPFTGEVYECSRKDVSVDDNAIESRPKSLFKSSRNTKR